MSVADIPKAGKSKLEQRERRLPTLFVRLRDAGSGALISDVAFDVTRRGEEETW